VNAPLAMRTSNLGSALVSSTLLSVTTYFFVSSEISWLWEASGRGARLKSLVGVGCDDKARRRTINDVNVLRKRIAVLGSRPDLG
jgi:hypothetical protein